MRVHQIQVNHDLSLEALTAISQKASQFQSDIQIHLQDGSVQVDVKSLLGLIMQRITVGTDAILQTSGKDELEALEAMCAFFEQGIDLRETS